MISYMALGEGKDRSDAEKFGSAHTRVNQVSIRVRAHVRVRAWEGRGVARVH